MIRYVFDFEDEVVLLGANFYSKANKYLLMVSGTQLNDNYQMLSTH